MTRLSRRSRLAFEIAGAYALASEGEGLDVDDLDWLMTLIVARASNAEYHRAKAIVLRLGARWPEGLDATNAAARLRTASTEDIR